LYAYVVFGLAAPWAALLPAALVQAHSERSRGDRFALVYFWSVFLFFTASSSRRSYYLLPILPAVALLVARLLTTPAEQLTPWARRLTKLGVGVITVAVVSGIIASFLPRTIWPAPWDQLPALPAPLLLGVVPLLALISYRFTPALFRRERLAFALSVLAYGFLAYVFLIAVPETERYRTQKPFLAEVREQLGGEIGGLELYRTRECAYYLAPPNPLVEINSADELRSAGTIAWLLARERDLAEIGFAGDVPKREPAQPWEPPDVLASKLVLLKVRSGPRVFPPAVAP
jgi:4-amino-4-deoxy-L-arabinose transferase-like glycosyltransferase